MKTIDEVRQQFSEGSFDFSQHAFKRAVERNISDEDLREAGSAAEVLESYPGDKYAPSVLLLGFTSTGRPLHLQVALHESSIARIITLYEPDPAKWLDNRRRR